MHRKAFTLIELLVVIIIIGILISISVYGWSTVSARGRDTTRKSDLAQIKQSLKMYFSDYRAYPQFDSFRGDFFQASWQLKPDGTTCTHYPGLPFGLPPKYMAEIPTDPKDSFDYSVVSCENLRNTLSDKYLYLTSSTAAAPDKIPNRFGLMSTLEKSTQDHVLDANNPFKTENTYLGAWYKIRVGNVNANYLLSDSGQ